MKATGDTSEATLRETRDESGIEKGSEGKTKTLAAGAEVKFAGEAIKEKSKYKNEEGRLLVRAAAVDVVATTIAAACAARLLRSKAAATSISS